MNEGHDLREKLEKVVKWMREAKYVVVLTGAGISTESGIPDYRGPHGIWKTDPEAEQLAYRLYELFLQNPKKYWEERLDPDSLMSRRIFSSFSVIENAKPNRAHYILAELERIGVIKCIITQNVDSLHQKAGSRNVIEFHGSYFRLRCIKCNKRFPRNNAELLKLKEEGKLPPCCECGGPLKDDGVFFGEPIPHDIYVMSIEEIKKSDLVLVCGTSAVVYPFAELPLLAKRGNKARIIEFNLSETMLSRSGVTDLLVKGYLSVTLTEVWNLLRSEKD